MFFNFKRGRRQSEAFSKLCRILHHKEKKWRLRTGFAEECVKLCRKRKISPEQLNQLICSFALKFMDDKVHDVRISGAELLAEIVSLYIEKEWPSMSEDDIDFVIEEDGAIFYSMPLTKCLLANARKEFLRTNSWRRRQTWAIFLEFVSRRITKQQFCFIFRKDASAIAHDTCRNSRLKFCQIFESLLQHKEDEATLYELYPSTYSFFRTLIEKMAQSDSDFEIQTQAKIMLGHLNPITDCLDFNGFVKKKEMQQQHPQSKQKYEGAIISKNSRSYSFCSLLLFVVPQMMSSFSSFLKNLLSR